MTKPDIVAPVLTPFHADLSPDPHRFVDLCRRLSAEGLGLAPFGTTGEGPSLDVFERTQLIDALVHAGFDMSRVMPGTGCPALPDTVRLTRHAVESGCGAVLMLPPYYYKQADDDGLFAAYDWVIERVGDPRLRICLYHFPAQSGVALSPALIERLVRRHPSTIAAIKDSAGDVAHTQALRRRFPGLTVYTGSASHLPDLPGAGCISGYANLWGPLLLRLAATGSPEDQAELAAAKAEFQGLPFIAAAKRALARLDNDPAWTTVRPPLVALA